MRTARIRTALLAVAAPALALSALAASPCDVEPWRVELRDQWRAMPEPVVTPYTGPFGRGARAFKGTPSDVIRMAKEDPSLKEFVKDLWDWKRVRGYDPADDPREIDLELEAAAIEDWRRMGYNCSYKGNVWSYRSGRYLKSIGMLGAIDQTLWGANGPPPLQFDGVEGKRQREACGSFFHPDNFAAGVTLLSNFVKNYGDLDMFKLADHYITCSWDEVGLRTRAQMDYRDPMREEFRKFLGEVWFQDAAPGKDTNKDGRTYNAFTGEKLATWDEVEPLHVSLDWTKTAWSKGKQTFSKSPDIDRVIFEEPGRYKLLVDFHRYFTFEFFRRVNDAATASINDAGIKGRVTCYPFAQHFIIWPGANQRHGNSFYWYHRLCPVVNVEHCWSEQPVMNLNYGITDRMAEKFSNVVMGWVWFYFGKEGAGKYDGPHDLDRALARMMGHKVDGTHHWLYSPVYRGREQAQRLQIAYWQNFFKAHHANYLSTSAPPRAQIGILMPDYTGYFYRYFKYPKVDWAYTGDGLQSMQYQYEVVLEEDLELSTDALDDYKVLYVVGSEWTTPTIRRRIDAFIKRGGIVFANVDSLSLDIPTGKRTDYLQKTFGVDIQRKYKNGFYPSAQTADEAVWALWFDVWGGPAKLQGGLVHEIDQPWAWARLYKQTEQKWVMDAETGKPKLDENDRRTPDPSWQLVRGEDGSLVRDEAMWKQLDEHMADMPKEVHGIAQGGLDMRAPPRIRLPGRSDEVVTWGEVDVAKPVGKARPIAWYGEEVCGIETERTVWLGTRPGISIHAISPRVSLSRGTEPCNPFPSELPELYESHRPYAEAIGYAARKASITRPVTALLGDKLPMNLEVLPRVDKNGTLMVVVISHDKTEATYDVTVDAQYVKKGMQAWDMLNEQVIEEDTDGQFKLKVPSWGVSVFMLGTGRALEPMQVAQAALNKMDMSVPKYYLDRPELNQSQW